MSGCWRARKRDEGPRTSAVSLLPRHRPAVAALLRCRRISNPAGQGGAPRLSPARQGGITNPASARGSRPSTTGSLPPHSLAVAGFPIRRARPVPQGSQPGAPASLAAAGFPIRRAKAVPHDSPRRACFSRCRRISNPACQGSHAGPAPRRARVVPHDSPRRGKAGLQIPPQRKLQPRL